MASTSATAFITTTPAAAALAAMTTAATPAALATAVALIAAAIAAASTPPALAITVALTIAIAAIAAAPVAPLAAARTPTATVAIRPVVPGSIAPAAAITIVTIASQRRTRRHAAEHLSALRIDAEPDHATIGRHPFEAIGRMTVGSEVRTFRIIEGARNGLADMRQNTVERRPAAPILSQGRKREREHQYKGT